MSKMLGDNDAQRNRFIKAAQLVGADEDEATFKAKLAAIARQKPKEDAAHITGMDNEVAKNKNAVKQGREAIRASMEAMTDADRVMKKPQR